VRIYDEYHSVPTILQQIRRDPNVPWRREDDPTDTSNIDLQLLQNSVSRLPVDEIRERRRAFNLLYEEAMLSADEKGISFTGMLLMLAHYKFIDDNKALRYLHLSSVLISVWMSTFDGEPKWLE
jgi:voltage-dependent calcium channel